MNIKQIEEQSGMPRANIRYYEQQGLLAPARQAKAARTQAEKTIELKLLPPHGLFRGLPAHLEGVCLRHGR